MESSPFSVLLVEDEQSARENMCTILSKKYPEIMLYVAEDGKVGLEIFKDLQPGIVITDICMPQMDGYQLAFNIKSLSPSTLIIATTAYSTDKKLRPKDNGGINHYIHKPIIFTELFAAVDKCFGALAPCSTC